MLVFFTNIINWLQQHELPCLFKQVFKIDCPGCGIQRSFIALLKGNFLESLKLYPGLMVMLLFFIFLLLDRKFQFSFSTKMVKAGIACIFITILVSYIVKLNY